MSDRLVTKAIVGALRVRFCAPEWALFCEVARSTGGMARSADAIAMNLYPSRGLRVHGVEVKASRSDWLRELRAPNKSEDIQQFCDHWWIAAAPGVVADGELPPTWGLLTLNGKVLRQSVAAPKLAAKPMDRSFIAAMLRRASERAERDLRDAVDAKLSDERASIAKRIEDTVKARLAGRDDLMRSVEEFEKASGLKITDGWWGSAKDTGKLVAVLRELNITGWQGLVNIAEAARAFADKCDQHLPTLAKQEDECG